MDIEKALMESDLFRGLDRRAVTDLASASSVRSLGAREMLFGEGTPGSHFFLLLSGSVRAFKTSPEGKESTIKIITPGEIFAEAVMLGAPEYPASAVATEDSAVIAIRRESFRALMDVPEHRDQFIATVFGKLRYLTDQIHHLTSLDVEERFFRFLEQTQGRKRAYDIGLSKKDIASAIGTIPETFSRLLARLTRRGVIRWEGSRLELADGFWEGLDAE